MPTFEGIQKEQMLMHAMGKSEGRDGSVITNPEDTAKARRQVGENPLPTLIAACAPRSRFVAHQGSLLQTHG